MESKVRHVKKEFTQFSRSKPTSVYGRLTYANSGFHCEAPTCMTSISQSFQMRERRTPFRIRTPHTCLLKHLPAF